MTRSDPANTTCQANGPRTSSVPTPLRVRLAISADRWFEWVMSGSRAVHHGIWLGVLRTKDLAIANSEAYANWAQFRDDDHNLSGLTEWERHAVETHFQRGAKVLVASAGGGREVLGLERMGYNALGFDPSPVLVESGRHLLDRIESTATLMLAPPDRVPAGLPGPFDAVLIGWDGYTHIRGTATRVAFLRDMRALVAKDTPMVLSFFLRLADDRAFAVTRRLAIALRRIRGNRDPIEPGDAVAATFDHYFTWDEIGAELADGGFTVIESSTFPSAHVVCRAV